KRELEATTTLTYSTNSDSASGSKAALASPGAPSSEPMVVRVTSSAEYIVNEIKTHKRGVLTTLGAVLLITLGSLAFISYRNHSIESIAVLPFIIQNEGQNPGSDAETLRDAITDSIINNLSQLSSLNVKPRGAVLKFKDREVDPQEVAKALDVHAV